jgi:hypothetical protein
VRQSLQTKQIIKIAEFEATVPHWLGQTRPSQLAGQSKKYATNPIAAS